MWQCGADTDFKQQYCLEIISTLHKTQVFAQLRTKEQVCYLNAVSVVPYKGRAHFMVRLQSSVKSAEHLE